MGAIKIIWKTEIWKLFENWSFENDLMIEVMKIKSRNLSFENWNFEIEVLKIIWKLKFWRLNLEIEVLKIIWKLEFWKLFEDWNFED